MCGDFPGYFGTQFDTVAYFLAGIFIFNILTYAYISMSAFEYELRYETFSIAIGIKKKLFLVTKPTVC